MKIYWKYVKPYLAFFLIGPILMLTEVAGEIIMPKLMAAIVDVGIPSGDKAVVAEYGIKMVLTALAMLAGGIGGNFFAVRSTVSFATDLRMDCFRKVQNFSFENIDKFSTGSLVTRLTNDVVQLQNILRMGMVMVFRAPGMMIGALVMAFTMNARLALVLVVAMPVMIIGAIIVLRIAFPLFEKMQSKIDSLNTSIQENLTNVRVIKSFVREKHENERFKEANDDLMNTSLKAINVMIVTFPLIGLIMNLTTLATTWFGGNSVIRGDMEIGDLTAFITYITQILGSLMMVAMIFLNASRAAASSKRIKAVLTEEVTLSDDLAKEKDKLITEGKIEFSHVSFRYKDASGDDVLRDVNFVINPGETVGILGSTGSGKTTMVQLIDRLYDVTEGAVLVDDVNVKDYSLYNLREGVGMVLQKNVLFSGSIKENLLWGDEHASEEELKKVAHYAQADLFIKDMPGEFEMELGQGGVNVSGGQKQRLCIARALLKKPKILILDDSTSAVDTATEAHIRKAMREQLPGTTKLIIAQRISSVMDADRIMVIDDGQIVAFDKHEVLMNSCPEYKEIYDSQMEQEVTK